MKKLILFFQFSLLNVFILKILYILEAYVQVCVYYFYDNKKTD